MDKEQWGYAIAGNWVIYGPNSLMAVVWRDLQDYPGTKEYTTGFNDIFAVVKLLAGLKLGPLMPAASWLGLPVDEKLKGFGHE